MDRRDKFTFWAITLLFANLSAYFYLLSQKIPDLYLIIYFLASLILYIRFYIQSVIAYAYIVKFKYIIKLIEENLLFKKSNFKELEDAIDKYDHRRYAHINKKKLLTAQLKAGYSIIIGIPLIFTIIHSYIYLNDANKSPNSFYIYVISVILFILYICYEAYIFKNYTPVSQPPKNKNK